MCQSHNFKLIRVYIYYSFKKERPVCCSKWQARVQVKLYMYTTCIKCLFLRHVRDLALDLHSVPWIHLVPHEVILGSINCHNSTSTYKRKAGMTCSHDNGILQKFVKLE